VATDGTNSPLDVTPPSGWTTGGISAGANSLVVLLKEAGGSESGTFTFTLWNNEQGAWVIYRIPAGTWYGGSAGTPDTGGLWTTQFDTDSLAGLTSTGATVNPDPPVLNPANWDAENTLWIAAASVDTSRTISAFPSGMTNTGSLVSGGSNGASLGYARLEAGNSQIGATQDTATAYAIGSGSANTYAQSFIATGNTLSSFSLALRKAGTPGHSVLSFTIKADSSGQPAAGSLWVYPSNDIYADELSASWQTLTFSPGLALTVGTKYWITVGTVATVEICGSLDDYASGAAQNSLSWGTDQAYDLYFNASFGFASYDPDTFTISNSDDWAAATIAIRPKAPPISVVAQAQAQITSGGATTYTTYAQSQADIKQTYQVYGQSRAVILNDKIHIRNHYAANTDAASTTLAITIEEPVANSTLVIGFIADLLNGANVTITGGGKTWTPVSNSYIQDDIEARFFRQTATTDASSLTQLTLSWVSPDADLMVSVWELVNATIVPIIETGQAGLVSDGTMDLITVPVSGTGIINPRIYFAIIGSSYGISNYDFDNPTATYIYPLETYAFGSSRAFTYIYYIDDSIEGIGEYVLGVYDTTVGTEYATALVRFDQYRQQIGQAQAYIGTPVAINRGYAQAQANILTTYNSSAQAQARILATYQGFAQGNAWIKITQYGYAQANSSIIVTSQVFAQSQVNILATNVVVAQAQASIKASYQSYAQVQAQLILRGRGVANAQAVIDTGIYQATDTYTRTITDGWGTADPGGDWVLSGIGNYSIADWDTTGTTGTVLLASGGNYAREAALPKVYFGRIAELSVDFLIPDLTGVLTRPRIKFNLGPPNIENSTTILINPTTYATTVYITSVGGTDAPSGPTITPNEFWTLKLQAVTHAIGSATVRVKLYKTADGETVDWIGTNLNTFGGVQTVNFGQPRLVVSSNEGSLGTNVLFTFDNFNVTKLSGWRENKFAQARARIKGIVPNHAQAQAQIKQTYTTYAQAQAQILVPTNTYTTYAQAQTWLKVTGNVTFAQAQSNIKQIYQGYAQSQARIKQTYQAYAQSQATIISTYAVFAQVQANVKSTYQSYAQAQGTIKQTSQSYSNTQTLIKQFYQVYAQASAWIEITASVFAQAQTGIKTTYQIFGQAQADIKQTYVQYAQAQAQVKQTYSVYAQSQAQIIQTYQDYAQALAWIVTTQQGYAQAQGTILAASNAYAQAEAKILGQATITDAYAQAQSTVLQAYQVSAQAQAQVLTTYVAHAQAASWIRHSYEAFASTQSTIKTTYNAFAQSQTDIKQAYQVYANAQAQIKTTYQVFAQADTAIKQTYTVSANAQATIKATYSASAQANAYIFTTFASVAQAQAAILATINASAQALAYIYMPQISRPVADIETAGWLRVVI
jgi:hypothetical protein